MRLLFLAAVLPAVFLMVQVYKLDRKEREPVDLLVGLVFRSVLSVVIAIVLERAGGIVLPMLLPEGTLAYNAAYFMLVVGLAEEGAKFYVLKRRTWDTPEFNCRFDGVVYAVTVSLGFALWENISYVLQFGLQTALLRAVTAIPGHACFGVFMGVWYGAAKHCERAGGSKTKALLRRSVIVPMILHGIYDTIASLTGSLSTILFVAYIAVLFLLGWTTVRRAAREDLYFG